MSLKGSDRRGFTFLLYFFLFLFFFTFRLLFAVSCSVFQVLGDVKLATLSPTRLEIRPIATFLLLLLLWLLLLVLLLLTMTRL